MKNPRQPKEKTTYKDTKLINFPEPVTVREVESLLRQNTHGAKKRLLFVIFHRLNNRYIRPLNQIPSSKRSGFLIMAAGCLLIESLQAFRDRKEYTMRGTDTGTFRKFFSENQAFSELVPVSRKFYKNIRCGVLHQAETYGNWLVIRERGEPLLNSERNAINADIFFGNYRQACVSIIANCLKPNGTSHFGMLLGSN